MNRWRHAWSAFAAGCASHDSAKSSDLPPNADACSHPCLRSLADRYVTSLVPHGPQDLPLSPFVRFTENGKVLKIGQGAWRTIDDTAGYRAYVSDPEAGFGSKTASRLPTIHRLRSRFSECRRPNNSTEACSEGGGSRTGDTRSSMSNAGRYWRSSLSECRDQEAVCCCCQSYSKSAMARFKKSAPCNWIARTTR